MPIGVVIVAAAFAFVFSLVDPAAEAFPTGQVAHTGSPDVGAATCANCHQDSGLSASLFIDAPTSMRVNETTTVTITLRGGPGVVAGFNAASGAGTLLAARPGAQFVQGEVTHVAPQPFSNGQAAFTFDWQAPAEATTVVWYAAGLSANADDATTGDAVATSQLSITIQPEPTATPTATPTSTGSGVIVTPTPVIEPVATAVPTAVAQSEVDGGPFGFGLSPQAGPAVTTSTAATDADGGEGLAVTGSDVALPAALSVVLFATGAATVVAGRRRQR